MEKFRVLEDCPRRAIMTKPIREGADIRVSTALLRDRRIPEPTSFALTQWCAVLCLVAQSCPALCNPMDCSPPGSSVHGDSQARILEGVAMPSSRGSSQPRGRTRVSRIAGILFTVWAIREDLPRRKMLSARKEKKEGARPRSGGSVKTPMNRTIELNPEWEAVESAKGREHSPTS